MTDTVTEQDEHRRTNDPTADGRERCHVDGYLWPCPTVRHRPEALLPGGEVLADEVGVGWTIYQRTPAGATYTPRGGIVVAVGEREDGFEDGDDDEPLQTRVVRTFRVIEWAGGRPSFLDFEPGDFDPLLSNAPNSASIRSTARKLCGQLATQKGLVSPFELNLAEIAARLYRSIA